MTAATCLHGMGSPAACIDCMDEGALPPPARPRLDADPVRPARTAMYGGRCRACDGAIVADQHEIVPLADGTGWMHEECAR